VRAIPVILMTALVASAVAQESIPLTEALVLPSPGRGGRSPLHTDAVEALIVSGEWTTPAEGDVVTHPDGSTLTWSATSANDEGWFRGSEFRGGYAVVTVEREADTVMLLEAQGHSAVYVNGRLYPGNPYRYGYWRLPVLLRAGSNELLFNSRRGGFRAQLVTPRAPVMLNVDDATLPDLVVGEDADTLGAVIVINASDRPLTLGLLTVGVGDWVESDTPMPSVPAMSARKVAFPINASAITDGDALPVTLRVADGHGNSDAAEVSLRVRQPHESRKRTFVSEIDGSVQYYAVQPARPVADAAPALFLTLHGAGVEAIGQADAYSGKTWGHIVAPTNRRPYGFDWEDWGRDDALEVLDIAQRTLHTDPTRTYLTGHSMGGHGAWHVAVTYPDRFAAVGPSAGWVSFRSYARRGATDEAGAMDALLRRAGGPSDTLSLVENLDPLGVYVLHGADDDNVGPEQARTMVEALEPFHRAFTYHEQPDAGHWWGNDDEPGADCVDWAPMFDLFARSVRPRADAVRDVRFTTANPSVSASAHWVAIEAQREMGRPASVDMRHDPHRRAFTGTTVNVARLRLDTRHVMPGDGITVELDGQALAQIAPTDAGAIWLARDGDSWAEIGAPIASLKGPRRYGPFKQAFRRRMAFVYGTVGSEAENDWSYTKARHDAEAFWYRGNGSVDVVSDDALTDGMVAERNIILYGAADTNGAWNRLLPDSPIVVRRGSVTVGDTEVVGDDLAALFVRPIAGTEDGLVGVVTGTGIAGMRLTERLPYFVSGVAYPDAIVLGPEFLTEGSDGVRVAGLFGGDWGIETGEFVWAGEEAREEAGEDAPE
jgi:dienelactone hydrolase